MKKSKFEKLTGLHPCVTSGSRETWKIEYYRHNYLASEGYEAISAISGPHLWELRRLAIETDTPQEHICAFRIESGWKAYLRPGFKLGSGFQDHPLMSCTN